MTVKIAIPEPTSSDAAYNQRSLPQYLAALEAAGTSPIVVPVNGPQDLVARLLAGVQGILLPGSGFDVDPERYGEERIPECGAADPARTAVDELLLQEGFNLRKPILAICHGTQNLNVWLNGTLIQDIQTQVNHRPGRTVVNAHPVQVAPGSKLAALLHGVDPAETQVNSSHHQAVRVAGDKLLVTAVSPGDGIVEAIELDSPDHFVLGVQWHPERTYTEKAFSRAIFAAFVQAASVWQPKAVSMGATKG